MGPAFSALILLVVGAIATMVCFVAARLLLPTRDAALLAVLVVVSGGVGCAVGGLIQIPFTPDHLESRGEVLRYLGVVLAAGLLAADSTLHLFLRRRARRRG